MKTLVLGSAALISIAMGVDPAQATDLVNQQVLATDWAGFYVGAQVGLVSGSMKTSGADDVEDCYCLFPKGDIAQTLEGGHIGYNLQWGNIVPGLEADINARSGEGVFAATKLRTESTYDASIRARLGLLITHDMLIYGTGGFAFGNFKTSKNESLKEVNSDLLGGDRTGWTIGGGLEYALDPHWSADISYRYTDWGSESVTWNYERGNNSFASKVVSSDLTDNRIVFGMNYKFAGEAEHESKLSQPSADWNGFYIGGQIGASAGQIDLKSSALDDADVNFVPDTLYGGFTQILAGGHAGYNLQFNDIFVAGVEGDINNKSGAGFWWARQSRPTSDWDGSLRGRVGILVTPQGLLYGTAGWAFGHFSTPWHETPAAFELQRNLPGGTEPQELLGGDRNGWTVGAGIQYALDNNWSTGIEYRYTDWGSEGVQWSPDEEDPLKPAKSELTESRIMTRLTYKPGASSDFAWRNTEPVDWTGVYVGAGFGGSASSLAFREPFDLNARGGPGWEFSEFTQGNVGGVIGYDYELVHRVVVGIEGDFNAKFGSNLKFDDLLRITSSWDAAVRGRLGYLVTTRGLAYVTGGWVWGDFDSPQSGAQERCNGQSSGPSTCSEPAEDHVGGRRDGWTVGGGLQYALDRNWSTRIEYDYTDWGTKRYINPHLDGSDDPGEAWSEITDNRVRLIVGYKFGGQSDAIK